MGGRNQGNLLALLVVTVDAFVNLANVGATTYALPGRFDEEGANQGRALTGDMPQSVRTTRCILLRDQSEIAPDGFIPMEPPGLINVGHDSFPGALRANIRETVPSLRLV